MRRSTLSGTPLVVSEVDTYSLRTTVPDKWVIVDLETGASYSPSLGRSPYDFNKSSRQQLLEARAALDLLLSRIPADQT